MPVSFKTVLISASKFTIKERNYDFFSVRMHKIDDSGRYNVALVIENIVKIVVIMAQAISHHGIRWISFSTGSSVIREVFSI